MTDYRHKLPQLGGDLFLTDAGIETTLIFHDGLDLPHFAAFHLFRDETGRAALERYFRRHAGIALDQGTGFIFESATWRASPDWGSRLGYSVNEMAVVNSEAIELLAGLRRELADGRTPMVISGCVGPRGDGYDPGALMTPEQAESYHAMQINAFADSEADMVTAATMTNCSEAIGVARAARKAGMPVVISFTVETDGRLPTGQPLNQAIEDVDAATGDWPAYYMVNCAHTTHFDGVLEDGDWLRRLRGIRANASRLSHAELDEAEVLDDGDPVAFGAEYAALRSRFPWINVLGGCCGTDHRHIERIGAACKAAA